MAPRRSGRKSATRIIGGKWRGRKLPFAAEDGLRPTPDRVRETVFNWLAPHLPGAVCLDLFAGSGALGLEALSRGARRCVLVDSSASVVAQLGELLTRLAAEGAECRRADAREFLFGDHPCRGSLDLVFLDPPFQRQWLTPVCALLEENQWLRAGAHIYLESAVREPRPQVPANWREHRQQRAGEVCYQLFVRA